MCSVLTHPVVPIALAAILPHDTRSPTLVLVGAACAVIVNLIGSTKTRTGLTIKAELDENTYPTGIKVSDEALAAIRLKKDKFHGDWNYTILPRV